MTHNPAIKDGVFYLDNGRENLDGAKRLRVDSNGMIVVEKRIQGLWQPASFKTGPNSLFVGDRVGIAAAGHHLLTEDTDGHLHFHAHSTFDGETTTEDTKMLNVYNYTERFIGQPDSSGSWTGTDYSVIVQGTANSLIGKGYLQTDTTAATEPVRIQVWEGTDETGPVVLDQTHPASHFPASSEIQITFDGYLEFDLGVFYFIKYTSNATFSLKMDVTNTYPWSAADLSEVREDDMLQTAEWISGNTYTSGDYSIQNNKIYVCNITGVQTDTFASNSDKWEILTSNDPGGSNLELQYNNNEVLDGAAGVTFDSSSSAILALTSSTQGFLPPRMTTAQRNAITSPATGLIIYNTTNLNPQVWGGESWTKIGHETLSETLAYGNTTGGHDINISSGDSIISPTGTDLNINVGNASASVGGNFNVQAGDGGNLGGGINLTAGAGSGGFKAGDVIIKGGSSAPTQGDVTIAGGDPTAGDSHGGDVYITGSDKGASSSQKTGGSISLTTGQGTGGVNGDGGSIYLTTPSNARINLSTAGVLSTSLGTVNLASAHGSGGFPGADISIITGDGSGNASGGTLELKAGDAFGNSDGGTVAINGGNSSGSGGRGPVALQQSGGYVGIGVESPDSLLHINDGSAGAVTAVVGTVLTVESSGDTILSLLKPDTDSAGIIIGEPSNNYVAGIEYNITGVGGTPDGFQFSVNGGNLAMVIDSAGNVGIGTNAPESLLNVYGGSAGSVAPDSASAVVIEDDTTAYLSFLTPSGFSSGIVFGNETNNNGTGIYFNDALLANGLLFEVNDINNALVIDSSSKIGMGILDPVFKLHIKEDQNAITELRLENKTTGTAARATIFAEGDSGGVSIEALSSGFTTAGALISHSGLLRSNASMSNGLTLIAEASDAPIRFYTDGTTDEKMRIFGDGTVNIGTIPLDGSAILNVASTTRGFLKPRMTEVQRDAISSPAAGLEVFNTDRESSDIRSDGSWLNTVADPENVITIATQAQWDDLSDSTTISIDTSTTILVKTAITTDKRIAVVGAVNFSLLGNKIANASITYTGGANFITADGIPFLRIHGFNSLHGNSTGTFLNIQNSTIFIEISSIGAFFWDDLGTITDCAQFRIPTAGFFFSGAGFKLNGVGRTFLKEMAGMNIVSHSGAWFTFNNTPKTPTIAVTIGENTITLKSDESLLSIDPDIGADSRIRVEGVIIVGDGELFESSGGTTGAFADVNDASLSGVSITSVTNSGGIARFHFAAADVFIYQQVEISGFVTNTDYNVTGEITAKDSTWFEVSTIPFGSDETGSFDSDCIILLDIAHGLSDGDTFVIDTDGTTAYDGGYTVFGVLTDVFKLNKVFTTDESGTWDTTPLNQTDPRVLSFSNPGFGDSKYIATAYVNNNSTVNGTIVNNTFRNMTFGTSGSALIEGSTIEGWKLIDDVTGTFEYTRNEPFDGQITFDFNLASIGGNQDFRFKWEIDTGSGFGDLPDNVEALVDVGNDSHSITKTFPLAANKGDQIKPQITRNLGNSTITTSYATIYANQ